MDWVDLYRLLEVVDEDVRTDDSEKRYKQIYENGWVREDGEIQSYTKEGKIRAFTETANNSEVIGDLSRHGMIDGSDPFKDLDLEAVTLREARLLITDILLQWLEAKVEAM